MDLETTLMTAERMERDGQYARAKKLFQRARQKCTIQAERVFCDEAVERLIVKMNLCSLAVPALV